ncbi:hypothetical protein BGW39_006689 [Mortierella sp. 14UC]|nr:hypothetical protein BGW39_006689 [Mortierella sp. 14UC]
MFSLNVYDKFQDLKKLQEDKVFSLSKDDIADLTDSGEFLAYLCGCDEELLKAAYDGCLDIEFDEDYCRELQDILQGHDSIQEMIVDARRKAEKDAAFHILHALIGM